MTQAQYPEFCSCETEAGCHHYSEARKIQALLDEACRLLEGGCVAIEGLLRDGRMKKGHPDPAAGARAFLKRHGYPPYEWVSMSAPSTDRQGVDD